MAKGFAASLGVRAKQYAEVITAKMGTDVKAIPSSFLKKIKKEHGLPSIPWGSMEVLPGISPEWRAMPDVSLMDAMNYYEASTARKVRVPKQENSTVKVIESKPQPSPSFQCYIPSVNPHFVELGKNYEIVKTIIASKMFYPIYIFGISGLGKTTIVEQACANTNREFFRCQITRDTIDEDLVGTMHLENGNTVWHDGPVIKAYRSGGVLLLDEIDLNPYLMILQGILEGKPFYIKQTGELVSPAPGFTVIATGNSKGLGESEYVGTMVLNEAQRDRFAMYLEQEIPTITTEKKIAARFLEVEKISLDQNIIEAVWNWLQLSREAFIKGDSETFISTRRVHFLFKTMSLLGDATLAVKATLSCYDSDSSKYLVMLWKSVYAEK